MNGRMDGLVDGWTDWWMDGRTGGWTDGLVDGWMMNDDASQVVMDGWMDALPYQVKGKAGRALGTLHPERGPLCPIPGGFCTASLLPSSPSPFLPPPPFPHPPTFPGALTSSSAPRGSPLAPLNCAVVPGTLSRPYKTSPRVGPVLWSPESARPLQIGPHRTCCPRREPVPTPGPALHTPTLTIPTP